jgi:hypothetical protein
VSDPGSLLSLVLEALLAVGTLVGGAIAVPLAGVLLHHGAIGPWAAALATLAGAVLRPRLIDRIRNVPAPERTSWLRATAGAVLEVPLLIIGGFFIGHLLLALPRALAIIVGLPSAIVLILWFSGQSSTLRKSLFATRSLHQRRVLAGAGGLVAALTASSWHPITQGPETAAAKFLETRGVQAMVGSFRWIDPPPKGLRATLTRSRGVLLAKPPGDPPEVYLVKVITSHDGSVAGIEDAYNLSGTAAVSEAALAVWGKFAVWRIIHRGYTLSVEIADLRGGAPARGPGWTRIARLQRGITDWQETGQFRGVGRMSLKFSKPSKNTSFSLPAGRLVVGADDFQVELDLGRSEISGGQGLAELVVHERGRPGDLTTWTVDRLRAIPLIGSDGMQWVKGVAQRAAEQIESIEEEIVGIDADEAIAEELGGLLEQLPVASVGAIPGWPPAPLDPMIAPALQGEGQWVSLGGDSLVAPPSESASPFVFTFIRTDKKRPYSQVSLTLWDARRIGLSVQAGTREPKSTTGEVGLGLIPRDPEVLERVAAAFNGAFQAVHGEFGMVTDGRVLLPPKPYAATVAELRDGTTAFGTWPVDRPIPEHVISLRQNMTPLLVDDVINPYERHWWGGVPEGWTTETRTVRSGLCMTKEGFGAYFYSASADPHGLAEAMRRARCSYGIHLDMNAGHTGFEFYRIGRQGELPSVERPLDPMWEARGAVSGAPGWEFSTRLMVRKMPLMDFPRYVHLTSRDFFYLTRRYLLPGNPLQALDPAHPGDGTWRVELPHNAWPHAVAVTLIHVPSDGPKPTAVAVSALDSKQLALAGEATDWVVSFNEAEAEMGTGVWLTGRRFVVAEAPPTSEALLLARGAETPTEKTSSAACVGTGKWLYVADAPVGPHTADALTRVLGATGCSKIVFLPDKALLVVAGLASPRSRESGAVIRLRRNPFSGMERLFPETPVVPPAKWAILQRRRVDYGAGDPE